MLNQTGITTKEGMTRKTILVDEKNSTAFSCNVSNAGIDADANGKKIVKAGTPVVGDLTARDAAFTVATGDDATGVILHDVDVTTGTANSQVVVFGFVDISKLEADVVTKLTANIKKSLNMIKFVK